MPIFAFDANASVIPCRTYTSSHGILRTRPLFPATSARLGHARYNSSSTPDSSASTKIVVDEPKPTLISRIAANFSLSPVSSHSTGEQGTSNVRKLIELAKPEKKSIGIAIGLLVVSSSVSMLVPLTIGKLIDFFSTNSSTFLGLSFPVAAGLLALTFCVGAAANAGRAIIIRISGQRIIARIRNQAYLSTLRQEPEFADRSAGDIVSRLSVDTNILGDSVTSNLSDGLRALISATVGVAAMFWISAKLTMVMLVVVPPVSLGAVFYGRYLRKLSNLTQEALGDMSKTAEEKLNAFKTVAAYNSQGLEGELFSRKVDRVFQLAKREAYASGVFWGGSGLTGNLAMLCLLGYGGHLVSRSEITVGDLTSLLIYSGYVGGSVSGLTGFFTGLMKGVGAGSRVFWLLDRPSAIPLGAGTSLSSSKNGSIRFHNVRFTYPSRTEVEVLKGVNMTIERGTSVALVGASGSGKSSIQQLISRFYDPNEGTITFDGTDIRNFTPESWRDRIGVVFQDPILFEGTVHENIAYGSPNVTRDDVEEAARAANCDFIWTLPQGFDTKIGKASLSGGQRQRISIARALVRRPSILLLDEATSALDSTSENAVNRAIDSIIRHQNITVILAAHRLSSIARAERVVILEKGVISEEGRYDVLALVETPIYSAHPDQPPATLAEFTLIPSGEDNFDISLVDGFNIPMNVVPSISSCSSATCDGNVNAVCPPLLRTSLDEDGVNLACLSPCNAGFGGEEFGNRACCTGGYDNATACAICGVDYYDVFKDACKNSYAYPYDEKSGTALWTCGGSPNYEIEFCPSGSDYVGASPNNISNKYVDATATCTSMITAFATTFSVGPSPTATATIGTLSVVATAATGIDGAAAIGTGASQVASSFSTSAVASVASTTALSAGQDTSSSASVAAVSPVSSTLSVSSAASSSQASNSATSTAPLISTGADTVALAAAQPTSNVTSASSLVSSAPASSCRKQGQYLDIVSPGHSKRVNSISCSSLAFVTNVLSIEREQACPKRDQEALASGGGAETMDDP
ncbi:ATP-binding cassette, subfamily B (MDR/TAP), member 10, partial [Tremellales sp. Uapishka_1]